MQCSKCVAAALAIALTLAARAQPAPEWKDPSPHRVQLVAVEDGVSLEVLDWGGSGRPVVLLSGLGNSAHVFDDFAQRLASDYHVYGISRRGYGASSVPQTGYESDRLGDDVLAVLDALALAKPVLVGHSIGGLELSSIATRKPERIAGVVYLDAAYAYAFDDGNGVSMQELTTRLAGSPPPAPSAADLESFAALREWYRRGNDIAFPEAEFRIGSMPSPDGRPSRERESPGNAAILAGIRKYSAIRVPALAIFAVPHDRGPWATAGTDPDARKKADEFAAADLELTTRQANAFERGVPGARVVRLAGAHHYVFLSNEADVLREMRSFIAQLP